MNPDKSNQPTSREHGLSSAACSVPIWKVKAQKLKNDPSEAMRWLEAMTCGGSEFHDEPENCFNFLMREKFERWETIKRQQKRIRELEGLLSQNKLLS